MGIYDSAPWQLDDNIIRDADGNMIATVPYAPGSNDKTKAAIMTAAPDLLQVCIYTLTRLKGMSTDEFARGDDKEIRHKCEDALTRIMRIANDEDFSILQNW